MHRGIRFCIHRICIVLILMAGILFSPSCRNRTVETFDPGMEQQSISSRCFLYATIEDAENRVSPLGRLHPGERCEVRCIYPSGEWILFDLAEVRVQGFDHPLFTQAQWLANSPDMKAFSETLDEAGNLTIGSEPVDRDRPLPFSYEPSDLVDVDLHADTLGFPLRAPTRTGVDIRLRVEALAAFEAMFQQARREGIDLAIVSGYRSAEEQQVIFSMLTSRIPKQRTVARPGFSEHQLGTTADITCSRMHYMLMRDFELTPEGTWLKKNAGRFGIHLSYPKEDKDETGFTYEPWHFRYHGVSNSVLPLP